MSQRRLKCADLSSFTPFHLAIRCPNLLVVVIVIIIVIVIVRVLLLSLSSFSSSCFSRSLCAAACCSSLSSLPSVSSFPLMSSPRACLVLVSRVHVKSLLCAEAPLAERALPLPL